MIQLSERILSLENYIKVDKNLHSELAGVTKAIYEKGAADLIHKSNIQAFDELIIDGMDDEQIWQEIELFNKPFLHIIDESIKEIEVVKDSQEDNEDEFDDEDVAPVGDYDSAEESDINEDEVEDDEEIIDNADDLDESEEESDVDLEGDGGDLNYQDFYGDIEPSQLIDEDVDELEEEGEEKPKDIFEEDEDENEVGLSTFEKHNKKLEKIIKNLEEENIGEKKWTLKGEVAAKVRPVNSLLEEVVDFDQLSKPVPMITEEVTESLEDMIKKRIIDSKFDDVERKTTLQIKKLSIPVPELNEEKSKESLSQIYENEYTKNDKKLTSEEEERHSKIKEMYRKLTHQLNSLCNFHYTPKLLEQNVEIITDAMALTIEEKIPGHVSTSTLLAPQEIHKPKASDLKGQTELSASEKKKLRKEAKEEAFKKKQNQQEAKLNPVILEKQKAMKDLKKMSNVTILETDKHSAKVRHSSSSAIAGAMKEKGAAKTSTMENKKKNSASFKL